MIAEKKRGVCPRETRLTLAGIVPPGPSWSDWVVVGEMQIGLMEHLRIHVAHQHIGHKRGTREVQDLRGIVRVERRIGAGTVPAGAVGDT